jgi:hypothetical protein
MKKGKIILSAAAFIVTAGGVFAFKAHSTIPGHKRLYGKTFIHFILCTLSTCNTFGGVSGQKCHCFTTIRGQILVVQGSNGTMWTSITSAAGHHCKGPTTKWTCTK